MISPNFNSTSTSLNALLCSYPRLCSHETAMVFPIPPAFSFDSPILDKSYDDGTELRSKSLFSSNPTCSDHIQDAVTALNTLQSNYAIVDAIRKSGGRMNEQAIPEMIEWLRKLGYQVR